MAVPSFLQSVTYKTNGTPGTSHPLPSMTIRAQGGANGPSAIEVVFGYNGTTKDIGSVSDSAGNTWTRRASDGHAASQTNEEHWTTVTDGTGGPVVITIATSASVDLAAVAVEVDQVRPISTFDRAIATVVTPATATTGRISGAPSQLQGMRQVVVAGMAWNDNTKTATAGSLYTGIVTVSDSSGICVAIERKTAELASSAGSQGIGRFVLSAASTVPAVVSAVSLFRDGIVNTYLMADASDADIDNIEGVSTLYTTPGPNLVYRSSTSAPTGGTGASELAGAYNIYEAYSQYLKTGVTVGSSIQRWYQSDGGDDGAGYVGFIEYVFMNAGFGTSIDLGDEAFGGGVEVVLGLEPVTSGWKSNTWTLNTHYDPTQTCGTMFLSQGDTQGFMSGTWAQIYEKSNNQPQYLVLTLNYPVLAIPQRMLMGMGT